MRGPSVWAASSGQWAMELKWLGIPCQRRAMGPAASMRAEWNVGMYLYLYISIPRRAPLCVVFHVAGPEPASENLERGIRGVGKFLQAFSVGGGKDKQPTTSPRGAV